VGAFAQSIVATIRQPLLILDDHSVVRTANPAFCREFGLDPLDVVDHVVFEIDDGRWNVPEFQRLVADVQAGGTFDRFELRDNGPVGKRVIMIDAWQVRDEHDAMVALLAIDDVTEDLVAQSERQRLRRELEVRVSERTAALETANNELEAFSYSVSHDLRAPLRAIDGFSAQLLRVYSSCLDERGQHYLRRVRAATQQMGQLIDDLLQLSQRSRETLLCESVDLTALSTSIADELALQEPNRRVSISVRPGMTGWGDPNLLKVVLQNLIGNAWKFTGAIDAATIEVGQSEHALGDAYFVRDNGAGFDMNHAEKLFSPFQRLHQQQQFPGNGIGLALVARIINRHGGRVWAEASPGRGATFYFTLPTVETP